MELQNAHVLVTGASRGIGAAMARRFSRAGARVSVAARSAQGLDVLVDELDATSFVTDLLDPEQVDGLVPRVEYEVGPIDVLVNNAGLTTTAWHNDVDPDDIRSIVRLNLEAPLVLTRAVLPGMLERRRGHLVYTSSIAGTGGFPGIATYGATKAGLMNFVAALRMELKDTPLGTTVVTPGPSSTDMWQQFEDEDAMGPMISRLRQFQLIPEKSPDYIAKRTVSAVASDRRHARTPRRLSASFWLREVPTRATEAVLTGVPTGPR
jgi:NADP-dependent 3-hydroxy acid dehydrogenase YdfG